MLSKMYNSNRWHWRCRICHHLWETELVATHCPECTDRRIHFIDIKTYQRWKAIKKDSREYIKLKYPKEILTRESNFYRSLMHGDFDDMPWASGFKAYFLEEE